jgi:hypothetical protein
LQNSPNFRQFSAADLNISRDSRAGFFLKRAQDVPNYLSTADNFLVENGRRSLIETSRKQVQKLVRFNHLSSAQIENSLEISAENSLHCEFAGLWLNVLPKNSTFTFDPELMRHASS